MNRYFDKTQEFDSNSRIFNAYYTNSKVSERPAPSVLDSLRAKLFSARRSKLLRSVSRIAKPIVFSASLIGLLGIAAAIEAGSLGLGSGLTVSAILVAIEYLCIRSHRA